MDQQANASTVWVGIDTIHPYEFNPKEHTEAQLQHVAASINQFGWAQPIVTDEKNIIIIGHGRYRAAKEILKLEKIPVWVMNGLTEEAKSALRVTDNNTNMETSWDMEKLQYEMENAMRGGMDVNALGLNFDFAKLVTSMAGRETDKDTTDEKLDTYLNNTVKQIVLLFETQVYEEVLMKIREIMTTTPNLINNTEVFLHLLDFYLKAHKEAHADVTH